jgi:perosamine synthetase
LRLLDAGTGMQAVRYRAVAYSADPRGAIERLAQAGIGAIVPIEEWEMLDTPDRYPNAQALARSTISLPIYPSLGDGEVDRIAAVLGAPLG